MKDYNITIRMDLINKLLGFHFVVDQMQEKQMIENNMTDMKIRMMINQITMINNINWI